MTPYDLKQYVVSNKKIALILETLKCHGIRENKKDYRCGLPQSNDITKVSINKESLKVFIYDSENTTGDLFTLCMRIEDLSFIEANKRIHNILGLKYSWKNKEKRKAHPLDIFESVKRKDKVYVNRVNILSESILIDFIPYPHLSWIREGIMPFTCKRFNIMFSPANQRIVIPHRYWCGEENEYLGIMGRTVIEHHELINIPKYYPIIKFSKGFNLYGLQENYKTIQEKDYVVVAESEKSVLKRHSLLDNTVVAICGSTITDEQVKILIGLDVEIILAFDEGITKEHIFKECKKMSLSRRVSYIDDEYHLMKSKEAPMDKTNVEYDFLLRNRRRFN